MVTPVAALTLPHPLSTARIINAVAGRLPLSAQRPTYLEILISQGPIAKGLSRLPKGVGSSETLLLRHHWSRLYHPNRAFPDGTESPLAPNLGHPPQSIHGGPCAMSATSSNQFGTSRAPPPAVAP